MSILRSTKRNTAYINKASTLTDTAKSEKVTDKMKWIECYPTLINFLREIPRRNGVSVSYLCIPINVQAKSVYKNFIDKYVDKTPLVGQEFTTDAAEVHTYIVRFTSSNTVTETKMLAHGAENDGRLYLISLKDHYKGVGVNEVNEVQADKVMSNFFNYGENKPHMWWDEFEMQLTDVL